ncbi:MAG: hypothetical protein HYX68_28145 [Planctomycetes bacterium]|nr:hypothetical protein [Planctomycetota bacterium]
MGSIFPLCHVFDVVVILAWLLGSFCVFPGALIFACPIQPDSIGPLQHEKERKAIASIENIGGKVRRDVQGRVNMVVLFEKKSGAHLADMDVESIDFAAFQKLSFLYIVGRELTDRSLAHLETISDLQALEIVTTKVTDKGLRRLLVRQKSLYSLRLDRVPVSDKAFSGIERLNGLRMLTLSNMCIGNGAAKEIAKLDRLVYLDLAGSHVSDGGLAEIARISHLRFLDVSYSKIADKGLPELAALKNLRMLRVKGTGVSDSGLRQLKHQLPDLQTMR